MRKFRGTIIVEWDEHTASFWLGWKKYHADEKPDWRVGNTGVAASEVEHLEMLGHKVHIIDLSCED